MISSLEQVLAGAVDNLIQPSSKERSFKDQTFQEVFNTVQQSNNKLSEEKPDPRRPAGADEGVTAEPDAASKPVEKQGKKEIAVEAGGESPAEVEDKNEADATAEPDAEMAEWLTEKLAELKESDPDAFKKLVAGLDDMTFKDLLAALGAGEDRLKILERFIDMNAKLPAELKEALASGDPAKTRSAFESMGLDKKSLALILDVLEKPENIASNKTVSETAASTRRGQEGFENTTRRVPGKAPVDEGNGGNNNKGGESVFSRAAPQPAPDKTGNAAEGKARVIVQNAEAAVTAQRIVVNNNTGSPAGAQPKGASSQQVIAPGSDTAGQARTESAAGREKTAETLRRSFESVLMNKTVEKIKINVRANGRSNMTIKLDPPSLGKIDMRVLTHDNHVKAVIVAENREVRMIIERDIESLRTSLNNNGMKVDEIVVTSAGEESGMTGGDLARQAGLAGGRAGSGGGGGLARDDVEENLYHQAKRSYHDGLLDVMA